MSRANRQTDAEHTAKMVDLVRQIYPDTRPSLSHVVLQEVAPGVGWMGGFQRWADVLVLGAWPSKGLTLDGYEIKASKADLRNELADLDKHKALARYCNHWWLVAWDEAMLVDGLPDTWGVMVTTKDDHGERDLKVLKEAPELTPEEWPRHFVCSLVRNAYVQSPGAAYVARACVEARERGRDDGRWCAEADASHALEPLREVLYGHLKRWQWPSDPETVIKDAATRLNQGSLFERAAPAGEG